MTLVRYNPLNDFVPGTFGDLIESVLREKTNSNINFKPAVDIFKGEKEIELQLFVPGMKKEDFEINLENNVLEISGERILKDEMKEKLQKQESSYGKFRRAFNLSEEINQEKVSANYADGILTIKLPLIEKKDSKSTIKVS
ncbi:Hsp20/alpha crystallin family protein [Fulvivirga sp. 29W222]|uniref:Hsp20/alpha crystallin family protein n=1 Tax=Fulvivirga marina TaxID=2494733 RepID=A0A937FVY4_9BACT|nr:Hsp20/alpha crystallin family protein [Fulvivirga marina]MBL6447029.1 Hsp20/alpha crystallin family protein [Fulvivirga marina]